jgi:hypothetical protein
MLGMNLSLEDAVADIFPKALDDRRREYPWRNETGFGVGTKSACVTGTKGCKRAHNGVAAIVSRLKSAPLGVTNCNGPI